MPDLSVATSLKVYLDGLISWISVVPHIPPGPSTFTHRPSVSEKSTLSISVPTAQEPSGLLDIRKPEIVQRISVAEVCSQAASS
jgi:hypothetical protein